MRPPTAIAEPDAGNGEAPSRRAAAPAERYPDNRIQERT
jgi:hypothetical protein